MLTEEQIAHSWRQLFTANGVTEESIAKAESLIGQIRPESPLRHRLDTELAQIRKANKIAT